MDDNQCSSDVFEKIGELGRSLCAELVGNVCILLESVDPTSCGHCTHEQELSSNGTESVTNGWQNSSITFFSHWIIDKLVTSETVQVGAHCVYLKTPISLDMQLNRSPLQVQYGVSLVITLSCLSPTPAKKETAVSHSSTASDVISSDTGLRVDPLTAK